MARALKRNRTRTRPRSAAFPGLGTFFCDTCSPWQKGVVEYASGACAGLCPGRPTWQISLRGTLHDWRRH